MATLAPTDPEDEAPVWSRAGALHLLERVGHVWLENPLTLAAFLGRLLAAAPYGLGVLGSRRAGAALWRVAQQFLGTLFRGVVLAAVLGLAGGLAVGTLSRLGGSYVQPLLEQVVLVMVVRDLAPLGLALALAARMGASITTRLAVLPARANTPVIVFGRRELNRYVVSHLVAGLLTAPLLFFLLAWLVLAGYETSGMLRDLLVSPWPQLPPELRPYLLTGALRAAAFGWIVAFVSSALGVRAAERFASTADEEIELHEAVWEASATSILICTALTMIFLTRAGNP